MKKHALPLVVAGLMVLGSSLAWAQNIAIVNGKAVPQSRLDTLAQQITRSGRTITPEMQGPLKDEIIAREVFMQEADRLGLGGSADFKNQMELAKQTILIRELFADFQKKNPISDEELKAEYDKFVATNGGTEYKARHILVEKEEEAKAIIARLKKGAKFDDIAKKLSKDTGSGANGGNLDWANPNSYVKEFSVALVKLNKGQTTQEPVKTQFGYHIIRLDDTRVAQLPAFDELKPQIAQQLQQQRLSAYQQELRAKAKVE